MTGQAVFLNLATSPVARYLQAVLLKSIFPSNSVDNAALNFRTNLSTAFLISLALHILVVVVANLIAFTPHRYSPAVQTGVVVKLSNDRLQDNHEIQRSLAGSPASQTPIPADSPPRPNSSSLDPDLKSVFPQELELTDTYYRQSELTTPASVLFEPAMPQPVAQQEGTAELTLLIGLDGTVEAVQPGKSTLPPDYLDQLKAFFLGMKFQPGMIYGKRVKSRFDVEASTTFSPEIIESRTLSDDQTQ